MRCGKRAGLPVEGGVAEQRKVAGGKREQCRVRESDRLVSGWWSELL